MLQDIIEKWGGKEVTPIEVYTDIFKLGSGYIQKYNQEERNKVANPLGYYKSDTSKTGHYRVFFEDTFTETLEEMQKADFSIVNGITYFGRKNTQNHASKMFCMIFDLDGVTDSTLNAFFSGAHVKDYKVYPLPNYIALSGHGLHLYFLFEEPVSLYPNIKIQLKNFKYALTDKIWNKYTSTLETKQYQGINQGFRVIGGKTKDKTDIVRAYQINTHPFTLQQLGEYIPEEYRIDEGKIFKESKITLEQAKEKYPQWYERVVQNKNKSRKKWDIAEKVHGNNPFALYDWWKKQIESGATYHHRYFAIMCLAIYGIKCGVPEEQVKRDAYSYIPFMNEIAPDHPFTIADCDSALECYDDRYATFPIGDIEKLSDIRIKRNKRNGQKQADHLEEIRAIRDIRMKRQGKKWTDGNGRKNKQLDVQMWRALHPEGRKADCIRDTGLSKKTVYKYW
jgi:hypothetical protein